VEASEVLPNGVGVFNADFDVFANGIKVKGVGVFCNEEKVKLIGGDFEIGDTMELRIV